MLKMSRKTDVGSLLPRKLAWERVESMREKSLAPRGSDNARWRSNLQTNADSPKHDTTSARAEPLRFASNDFATPFEAAAKLAEDPIPVMSYCTIQSASSVPSQE